MKKNHLAYLVLASVLLGLSLIITACGTPSGVNTQVGGQGSAEYTEAAQAADEAIAAITQSDRIKNHGITGELGLLRVGCDLASPPLGYRANVTTGRGDEAQTSIQNVGFEIDLAQAVANKLGLELSLPDPANAQDLVMWKDLPGALEEGRFDVIVSAMKTGDGLEDTLAHTTPHLAADMVIVMRSDQSVESELDLEGKIVGVQISSTAQALVEGVSGVEEIQLFPHINAAFEALAKGEIDAVVGNELTCEWILANDADYADYAVSATVVTGEGYAFWCAKDDELLLEAIDAALLELREVPEPIAPTTTTVEPDGAEAADDATAEDATTTTTEPLPEAKSVYQLICEKWGLDCE